MKRRTLLERIGAAGLAAGIAVQPAVADDTDLDVTSAGVHYHEGECHGLEDPDCVLDDCSEYCPSKCCACAC